MKKYLAILLVLCMAISIFAACDSKKEPDNNGKDKTTEAPTAEQTPTVTEPDEDDETEGDPQTEPATDPVTEPATEPITPPETDPATKPETEPVTDPATEPVTEPETEPETGVHFNGKYAVEGDDASTLSATIKSEKLPAPTAGSDKVIYVGESASALTQSAKDLITRTNNYNDFAIITDGEDLAIWAGSPEALEKAIDLLIKNYTDGGHIAVPENFSYVEMPNNTEIKINGNTLEGMTVVAKSELQDLASGLAGDLTALTGYTVAYGESAEGTAIKLVATGSGSSIGTSYTLSYANSTLTLTAANKITLAYAITSLTKDLCDGLEIADGFNETYTLSTKTAAATDVELFKYCGTWQATDEANPNTMVSYWDAAYVEVDFTGNAITLMFSSATAFYYRVDNGEYVYVSNVTGDYTVYANGGGVHTVRVLYNDKSRHMYFAGVKAGEDTTLTRTPDRKYYVQFIGDSISDATNSFSHNSADLIDWDYSTIACEAVSLVKDMGYWRYNNGFNGSTLTEGSMAWHFNKNFGVTSVGMEDAFFKLGIPNKMTAGSAEFNDIAANYYTEKYDFNFATGNTPDIVFIFLGTNDLAYSPYPAAEARFVATYKAFVAKILAAYGEDTEIVVMQALSTSNSSALYDVNSSRYSAIRQAATELKALYPDNVTFLDENTLFSWGVEISPDNTHPSADGYATLSTKVAQWLEKKFK